jgi:hypothetical protein
MICVKRRVVIVGVLVQGHNSLAGASKIPPQFQARLPIAMPTKHLHVVFYATTHLIGLRTSQQPVQTQLFSTPLPRFHRHFML